MNPCILVVEDDESDVLFLERAFRKAGLAVPIHTVGNGKQVIAYLSGVAPFDDRKGYPLPTHLILDLKLPEKSGLEVLEWIRQRSDLGALPVAILTSSSESSDIRRSRELSADCYFVKPMSFEGLVAIVEVIGEWVKSGVLPNVGSWPSETGAYA